MSKSLSRFYAVAIKINIALLFAFLPCYFCLHALAKNHVAYADDAVVIDVPIVLDDEVETYGGVRVQKFDSETNKNIAQGNATLQGVKFAIKLKANLSASEINTMATGSLKEDGRTQKDVIVNNKTYSAGSIVTYIYTNSDGVAQTGSAADGKTATASLPSTDRTLPAGIYTIEEVSGDNKTYLTSDTTARTFRIGNNYVASNNATLRGDGVIVTSTFDPLKQKTDGTFEAGESLIKSSEKGFKNTVVRGGVKIRKQDFETKLTTPQGNASLNGTTFEIINKSSKAVLVDGTSYATGAVCKTITVKDGVAETASNALPYGSYTIREKQAGEGYIAKDLSERTFTIVNNREIVSPYSNGKADDLFYNQVIRGGVKLQKRDKGTGDTYPSGGATWDGTTFEIYNRSTNPVVVDGTSYAPGARCKILKLENGKSYVQTAEDALPYGTYGVKETESSPGYELTDTEEKEFSVTQNHEIVDLTDKEHSFINRVYRSDFSFLKKYDKTGDALPFTPFLIVSNTTGESHVVVTDVNGRFDSEQVKHSTNTNANDSLLREAKDGERSISVNGKKMTIDYENLQTTDVGCWFGTNRNGKSESVDDSKRAFPYDYATINNGGYTMYELPCEANKTAKLVTVHFSIYEDNKNVFYGTIDDQSEGLCGIRIIKGSSEDFGLPLEGAEFNIYNDPSCSKDYLVRTIVTDEYGVARSGDVIDLPCNTYYYIKETKAPTGYSCNFNRVYTVVPREDKWVDLEATEVVNTPIRGDVTISKYDSDTNSTQAQGNASLEGITFQIINNNDYYVTRSKSLGDTKQYFKGDVVETVTTDASGIAKTQGKALQYGHYLVKEVSTNGTYLLSDTSTKEIVINSDEQVVVLSGDKAFKDTVIKGGVKVQKQDFETKSKDTQGDATLDGTTFEIINQSTNPVVIDGTSYETGAVCKTITVKDGVAQTASDALPYGSYTIREKQAGEGYIATDTTERKFEITENKKIVFPYVEVETDEGSVEKKTDDLFYNQVIRGGVKIEKRDIETGSFSSLGAATLDGTTFEIINKSKNSVIVDGTSYEPDAVVKTLVIENGVAQTESNALPYGTYSIKETQAGEGYVVSDLFERTFKIVENNVIAEPFSEENSFYNQVIRGDIEFVKCEFATQNRMKYIPFMVTSLTTGESHVIVTDANGEAKTKNEWNNHDFNTNKNDEAVTKQDDGTYIVDESKLDSSYGVWFGLYDGDQMAEVNNTLGAMPYDHYKVEELQVLGNKDFKMITLDDVWVSRDGYSIDLGTINNFNNANPKIDSTSVDNHAVRVSSVGKVTDEVTMSGLEANSSYKLVGSLVDKSNSKVLKTGELSFETGSSTSVSGEVSSIQQMSFDIDIKTFKDKNLVVFQDLYMIDGESSTLVSQHNYINDEFETFSVTCPQIMKTVASNAADGTKVLPVSKDCVVKDKVTMSGLSSDTTYILKSSLINKSTKEVVKNGEDAVESSISIKGSDEEAQDAEISMKVDTSSAKNKQEYVVVEKLYAGDVLLSEHYDLNDSNQTVTVKVQNSDNNNDDKPTPSLKTTATEKVKGTKILTATTEQVVVDVVSYENLVAGKEYVMTGVLHKVAEDGSDAGAISKTETSVIFTPESSSGEISVELSVDATGMDGQKLVVFESCSLNDEVVATHEDIADEGQTVIVGASAIPIDNNENGNSANGGATGDSSGSSSSGSSPQTGDLWGKRVMSEAIILMFFSGALMLMVRHFKKIQIASTNLG